MKPDDIVFRNYRIEKQLGRGAFAEVFLVSHMETRWQRAVKVLRRDVPGLGSTEYTDFDGRFQLEAMLGNQINSPYVVRVYEFERAGETLLSLMEYCPGDTLTKLLFKKKEKGEVLEIGQVIQIGVQVAHGLAALHAQDAVHRDLKPSNILFDANGVAKVADLGLAEVPGGPSLRSQLSGAGMHPGTPGYMSPEQETGRGLLSPASDVYTLGVVLFEILSGKSYLRQRPGTRLASLSADTPVWLDDLVMRMLDKDPQKRPFDGAEAAELLMRGEERSEVALQVAPSIELPQPQPGRTPSERTTAGGQEGLLKTAIELGEWEDADQILLAMEKAAPDDSALQLYRKRVEREMAPIRARRATEDKAEKARKDQAAQAVKLQEINEKRKAREAEARRKAEAERLAELAHQKVVEAERKKRGELVELAPGVVLDFVCVPAGEFLMGSDEKMNEEPVHTVWLDEFWIAKTLVTNIQYAAFVKATGRTTPRHFLNGLPPRGKEYHPAINVTWEDAAVFCAWVSQLSGQKVRLPTEAEWEKAARGTDGRTYPWGNMMPDARRCNCANKVTDTTPVGMYSPQGDSPYGCVDMAGNVWEWVADWYDDSYYSQSPAANPTGPDKGSTRVIRGGSWTNYEDMVRSAGRNLINPWASDNIFGFRCVRLP